MDSAVIQGLLGALVRKVVALGTLLGMGTKEFGARDLQSDGSYVTTKFATVFYLPLWPLQTRRVRREIHETQVGATVRHFIVNRLSFCWPQVLIVLAAGWAALLGLLTALGFTVLDLLV